MPVYTLIKTIKLASTVDEVWNFIASPENLKFLTPPYMGFDIITRDLPKKMYPGMIISYKVSPFWRIKMTWVTEITHVTEQNYFVDEQRVGPYKMWHHQHILESVKGGVLMRDIIDYQPPFGFAGAITNHLIIKQKLSDIFSFRTEKLEGYFGKISNFSE